MSSNEIPVCYMSLQNYCRALYKFQTDWTLAKSGISWMAKSTNGALVTPTPGWYVIPNLIEFVSMTSPVITDPGYFGPTTSLLWQGYKHVPIMGPGSSAALLKTGFKLTPLLTPFKQHFINTLLTSGIPLISMVSDGSCIRPWTAFTDKD